MMQVHRATLLDGTPVVLKLQHPGTRRMMASDLFNMRLGIGALELLRLKLPFDLGSVVREYCEVRENCAIMCVVGSDCTCHKARIHCCAKQYCPLNTDAIGYRLDCLSNSGEHAVLVYYKVWEVGT